MEMKINSALIVELRSAKAWSQQHLADVAGLSLRTVQRVENTSSASPDSVKAIAMAFDKVPADLSVQSETEQSSASDNQQTSLSNDKFRAIGAGMLTVIALVATAYSYAYFAKDNASTETNTYTVSIDAVEQAAIGWLALIDAQEYDISWARLGIVAKASITERQWSEALTQSKSMFGEVTSRELRGVDTSGAMLGLPQGEYATLTFSSSMEKRPIATEIVTMSKESDQWVVIGYFIQ